MSNQQPENFVSQTFKTFDQLFNEVFGTPDPAPAADTTKHPEQELPE